MNPIAPKPLEPFDHSSFVPAASLTQDLPQGTDADILVLGAKDLRHVLYTLEADSGFPHRKLDITACDVNEYLIGKPSSMPRCCG